MKLAGAAGPRLALLLFIVTVAVFWPATGNDFTFYDDDTYVTANVWVLEGVSWAGIHWAFTTFYEANWHPLTWISHMLDVTVFGLRPFGHHLVNVLLHAANASLLFMFLYRSTSAIWRSFFVSALFALHPLHVESVAWVAERKDVLCGLFWMLSLIAYAAYVEKPGARRYLLLFAWYALGLLSKPMALTLPFALLLVDFWPLSRWRPRDAVRAGPGARKPGPRSRIFLEKIPFFVLAGVSALVTFQAQARGGAVGSVEHYPVTVRIANALMTYAGYLGQTFWPGDFAVIYSHPRGLPPLWQVLAVLALLAGISLAAFKGLRRRPWLAVGWLWFLGTLVPVIGLVQFGLQAKADRYTYLPLIGVFIAVCWGWADLPRRRGSAIASRCAAAAILAALAWMTRSQIAWWRNDSMVLEHAIAVSRDNWVAHLTLGINLEKQGRVAEAQSHYEAVKGIKRDFAVAHAGMGIEPFGPDPGGPVDFAPGGSRVPTPALASYRLGNDLVRQGRYREAVEHYAATLRLAPDFEQAHNNLGVALAGLGDYGGAAAGFRVAIGIRPDEAVPHINLGGILALQGDLEGAESSHRRAVKLEPDSVVAHLNLGDVLLAQGKTYRAQFEYREVLLLKPGDEEAGRKLQDARAPGRGFPPPIPDPSLGLTKYVLFP